MHLSGSKFAPSVSPKKAITKTGAQAVGADVRAAVATVQSQAAQRQAAARAAPIQMVERSGVFRYYDPSKIVTQTAEERAAAKAWREGRLDMPEYVPESMILSDAGGAGYSIEDEIMHEANTKGLSKRVLAQAQFLTWLQNKHPELAAAAINAASKGKLGQVEETKTSFSSIIDKITDLGGTYLTYTMQKKIIDMNIERAKIGLPPIDIAAAGAAPVVQTEVNISPELLDSLKSTLGGGMQQVGLLVAIGLGAYLIFSKR